MTIEDKLVLGIQIVCTTLSIVIVFWLLSKDVGISTTIIITALWADSIIRNQIREYFRRQRKRKKHE